jgi:peroxiredoxin
MSYFYKNIRRLFALLLLSVNIPGICLSNASEYDNKIINFSPAEVPEVAFYDQSQNKVFLEEYEGKYILVVFWATWSAASEPEMLSLDRLAKDLRKLPFKVIAISEDYKGLSTALEFAKKHELRHLEVFYDPGHKLFDAMGVKSIPTRFIITPEAKYDMKIEGTVNWNKDKMRQLIFDKMKLEPGQKPKNSYWREPLQTVPAAPKSASNKSWENNDKTNSNSQTNRAGENSSAGSDKKASENNAANTNDNKTNKQQN